MFKNSIKCIASLLKLCKIKIKTERKYNMLINIYDKSRIYDIKIYILFTFQKRIICFDTL